MKAYTKKKNKIIRKTEKQIKEFAKTYFLTFWKNG